MPAVLADAQAQRTVTEREIRRVEIGAGDELPAGSRAGQQPVSQQPRQVLRRKREVEFDLERQVGDGKRPGINHAISSVGGRRTDKSVVSTRAEEAGANRMAAL